jgi:hypothetical protein
VFVQKRFYESGGLFNQQTKSDDQTTQTIVVKDEETKAIMLAVLDRLNDPVAPVITNIISLKQIHDAEAQQARIEAYGIYSFLKEMYNIKQ